jgi:hypothetical protein
MTLTSRASLWCAVLGVFVWYGGLLGTAGADVLPTNVTAVSDAATSSPPRVCVVQIMASGEVMSVFADDPTHPDITVLVPPENATNVPVSCQDLTSLGLAVANQEAFPVNLRITVFTHQGTLLCSRGPFTLREHGARGVVFGSDCSMPVDTTPPAMTVAASPTMLWPPNGKLVPIMVSGAITDEPSGSGVNLDSTAYGVTDEYGQIEPNGSLTLEADGSYVFTVSLEASRRGNDQDGRHYTITVSAKDNAGNLGTASTVVTVPHDQGN